MNNKDPENSDRLKMIKEVIRMVNPDYTKIDKSLIDKYKEREVELQTYKRLIDELISANNQFRYSFKIARAHFTGALYKPK